MPKRLFQESSACQIDCFEHTLLVVMAARKDFPRLPPVVALKEHFLEATKRSFHQQEEEVRQNE